MEILYVSSSYPPAIGGAQNHLHQLAKCTKSLGHRVRIVTQWSSNRTDWLMGTTIFSGSEKKYEIENVKVSQLGFTFSTRIGMLPWALSYYLIKGVSIKNIVKLMSPYLKIAAGNPSLIHATRIGREFLIRASLDLAHSKSIPFVLTPCHHPRWKGFLYREYDKIYTEADAVLALTKAEKNILVTEKKVDQGRVHITGIGPVLSDRYSVKEFRQKYGLRDRFVLFLGQQYRYKGVKAILEAIPLVRKNHADVKFVFIGPHTRYSRKIFNKKLDNGVLNLGRVDLKTKTSALAACEFLCMPSMQESFGGVYVEAWSLRKAVIGGNIPPIASVIDHGINGFLSTQEPEELSEKISYLLLHPKVSSTMGNAGWKKVQQKYTWKKLVQKTHLIYEMLIKNKSKTFA